MKKEQVVHCQFSVWYPIFKKHTIKSLILPLPQNVIDYLLDDGTLVVSGRYEWSDDETTTTVTAPEFPDFTSKVLEAINALGGRVFPKLNWSAPRDANWIALNSSLQCHSLSDIFLLFKSSDFITHDLTQPFLQCSDQDSPDPVINYELVLRKWSELIPGGEFRCFVKENKLIVVFDVYRDSQGRVWLIDLNPFGEVTDSLLFTWEELTSGGEISQQQECPAFRYTTSEVTVQPSPCLSYRIPRDFVDLSTGEDAYKLIDFLKLKSEQEESDEEESSPQ
uniref:Translation initiation factor eIF2 assembly protein n=1 Tax=Mastacembelus armatus TaxID=205130 RepID=A0A3Q3KTY8_9TELE